METNACFIEPGALLRPSPRAGCPWQFPLRPQGGVAGARGHRPTAARPCSGGVDEPSRAQGKRVNWTLEVVVVPVSDVDRAKHFYHHRLGFSVDHDTTIGDHARIVQLTPPGSGCSIVIGTGAIPDMPPGSLEGLQLVVRDVTRARDELLARGVAVGEVQVLGENPGPVADPLDNVGFVFFEDPDGNSWAVQQISTRR